MTMLLIGILIGMCIGGAVGGFICFCGTTRTIEWFLAHPQVIEEWRARHSQRFN